MNLIGLIKRKAVEIEIRQNNIFNYSVEKQKRYLEKFPEPKNLIERSYFQYKCQMKLYREPLSFFLNILAFPLFVWYFFRETEECSFKNSDKDFEAIFFSDGKPENILPDELISKYTKLKVIEEKNSCYTKEDKHYIVGLWKKYPFSWLFLLKCLIKIRYYSYEIHTNAPKAIIVCNEYSFTSSMLTDYCHLKGIENINVMHGEKVYFMMDSFFSFDSCYVWHQHYAKLFIELRAAQDQFIIATPKSLKFSKDIFVNKKYDYVFYLGSEHGLQLELIINCLEEMVKRGNIIAVRPHPRYTNSKELKQLIDKVVIEDTNVVSIEESIMQTRNVISLFSTVLNQAYNNGVAIVIDDITDRERYKKLKEVDYIMLSVEHKLLSQCKNECNKGEDKELKN